VNDDELLNKWTTIKEAYGDKREAIKALDDGKSEVAKVLKYILDKDIPIKKIYAVTSDAAYTKKLMFKCQSVQVKSFLKWANFQVHLLEKNLKKS
jgi:hypothetical protein